MRKDARSPRLEGFGLKKILIKMARACCSNGTDAISTPDPFGSVADRAQKSKGGRRYLVSHAQTILTGLPEFDMKIWAHTAEDTTK